MDRGADDQVVDRAVVVTVLAVFTVLALFALVAGAGALGAWAGVAALLLAGVTGVSVGAMLLVRRRAPAGSWFQDGDRAAGVFGVLATGFSVVTTLERTVVIAEHLVDKYGVRRHCRRVRACDIAVLELENPQSDAYRTILAECRAAVAEDGCGAIVLGCAGMADLCAELTARVGVPVVDGVAAAVGMASGMVRMGLGTSKRDEYARPPREFAGAAGAGTAPPGSVSMVMIAAPTSMTSPTEASSSTTSPSYGLGNSTAALAVSISTRV